MAHREDVKQQIFSCISEEKEPIYKIAGKADVSVQTASKYCYILQAEGKISMEKYGNMQLVRRNPK